ncbi:AraC family transcriptional regulator [Endozoicomonas sp. OPT23]|uniref:GlxA family transcriptional regulator n=1 Tax=Endozoicomonas sp. OPT23 TaxID=2072845 RepID=UPI00129AFD78|nr:helix-turn-helix domain-containing protein [Endozoicomonas sp. OPT23]MRI33482.1 AraC family transcriptional regulator [Endozoicomonas sp. OPT23]
MTDTVSRHFEVGFILFPGFPLLELSAVLKTFKIANLLSGNSFKTSYYAAAPSIESDSGLVVQTADSVSESLDACVLIAGNHQLPESQTLLPEYKVLAGIEGGTRILASQNLLDGYHVSLSGSPFDNCRDFPNIKISQKNCEADRDRITCHGTLSATNLALEILASLHSTELAQTVAEQLQLSVSSRFQRSHEKQIIQRKQPQIEEAIELMEANIEEPLGADELASLVGISRRQLERLFRKHLDTVPSKHYLKLRLEQARKLLQETVTPVVEVGIACGFSNASHFSTAYKNHFGKTPREERS